jgi:hypothetical protein
VSASELRAAKPLAQRAVSNLPAGDNPRRQIATDFSSRNSHSPPCRRFPEGPRTAPVCIPFASAFQRPLTAHAEAR